MSPPIRAKRVLFMPLKLEKFPPTTILPSAWTAIEYIEKPPVPVPVLLVKAVSNVPSASRRAIPFAVTPLKLVKSPAIRILPSA